MAVDPQFETYVEILDMESGPFMYIDGVTTVTFFDGPVPLEQLTDRLVKVVQASPWLAGKLVKPKKSKLVQMCFNAGPTREQVLEKIPVKQIEMEEFGPDMPGEVLIQRISKQTSAHVKETGHTLLKKGLPYTKLTVVKNPKVEKWALILSISHTIADGYTYYKVLGMLSAKEQIVAFKPQRHHDFVPALKNAVGAKVYDTYLGATPLVMNFVANMTWGGKPKMKTFFVDEAKIMAAKQKSKEQASSSAGGGTDFVSTNDVITAWWGRVTNARLVEMAVNFRGRFPEYKPDEAGNYEGCILFAGPEDFRDPSSIRKALQREDGKFQSVAERKLPGFNEMRKCRYRIITNWASFFSELAFDGCTQTLHLPYMVPSSLPTDLLVIFKPTASTYGVYIVTRKLSDDVLVGGADSLLGKPILPLIGV